MADEVTELVAKLRDAANNEILAEGLRNTMLEASATLDLIHRNCASWRFMADSMRERAERAEARARELERDQ